MIKKFNVTDYKYVQFEKDSSLPWLLYIVQYDDSSYRFKEEIGRFDFFNNEGRLAIPNKGMKEFKRFSALLNNFFKYDELFGWNSAIVEDCKKSGITKRKEEKKRLKEKEITDQTEKANDYINNLKNKDTKLISVLENNFKDVTDEQLIKVINKNFKNAISQQLVKDIFKAIKEVLNPVEEKGEEGMLTANEKEVISTRLNVQPILLDKTVFTTEELKNANIISLINDKAELIVNDTLMKNENIDMAAKRSVSEWTNRERYYYNFHINNIKSNILDGTFSETVEVIRNEYKEHKNKLEHLIKVEKSFEIPNYEVTLDIFIERSNRPENILKTEHENIIKNAIEQGLFIPDEVIKDYTHLIATESTNSVENNQASKPKKVTYHFYKQTFSTYMEAYNYALNNMSPVTMILPSNHGHMTNERLQQLEYSYTFEKSKMSYEDMKEYFKYISELDITTDQQERYYKLKSYIDRYEYKERSKQSEKERLIDLMKDACIMLHFMKSKGLEVNSSHDCGISFTKYILNGNTIDSYITSSGIEIEKYHGMIKNMLIKHFTAYLNEYNSLTIHLYKGSYSHLEDIKTIQSFIYHENKSDTTLYAFDNPLSSIQLQGYSLTPHRQENALQAV